MKIAYFITGLGLGGAEVVTVGLANRMVEARHQVRIYYLNGTNEHNNIDPRIEVVAIDMAKTPIGMLQALRRAAKLMRSFKPDVVHGNMVHANLFVRFLRLFVRLPKVVCSEHSMDIRGRARMWAYRLTDFLSDLNTNVSVEATDHFIAARAFGRSKSQAIYNGINTSLFVRNEAAGATVRQKYGIETEEFLWLHVGRLTPAKDHRTLLAAFATVQTGRLLLLGKGELQGAIEAQIQELGLGERVILAGAHSNTVDYYSAADALVLSSAWEGLPTVVLEAMSCSLPVVTTDVGAARETIGDTRWIAPSGDARALACVMEQLAELPLVERSAIGAINAQKSKQFDIEAIAQLWLQRYVQ